MQRNLTLPQGTVNQTFCYDDLNRLTWSGSTGTPSCGTSLTAGNLTAATYTQTFSYDTLDRLTSGPNGTYSYSGGSGQPWHAVTSTSNGYKAWYDAAGEMICRAPTTSQTCTSSTQTGQTFTWDAMNRLTAWQNQPTSPTSSDQFAYDGEGKRVWQQSV